MCFLKNLLLNSLLVLTCIVISAVLDTAGQILFYFCLHLSSENWINYVGLLQWTIKLTEVMLLAELVKKDVSSLSTSWANAGLLDHSYLIKLNEGSRNTCKRLSADCFTRSCNKQYHLFPRVFHSDSNCITDIGLNQFFFMSSLLPLVDINTYQDRELETLMAVGGVICMVERPICSPAAAVSQS